MLALQIAALGFVLLSAAFMFGPQLAVYGARAVPAMVQDEQARFVGGVLSSIAVVAVIAPYFTAAMSSGGQTITLVMLDLYSMSFGIT